MCRAYLSLHVLFLSCLLLVFCYFWVDTLVYESYYTIAMLAFRLFYRGLLWAVSCASFAMAQTPGTGGGTVGVTGKWTFEQPGRGGNPGRPVTITLKADGSTLTGTMPAGGRGGGGDPIAISDGKVDGKNISFTVKRDMGGNTMVTKYEGTVNSDELKLKISRSGQDGTPVTTDVVAKRGTT